MLINQLFAVDFIAANIYFGQNLDSSLHQLVSDEILHRERIGMRLDEHKSRIQQLSIARIHSTDRPDLQREKYRRKSKQHEISRGRHGDGSRLEVMRSHPV